MRTLRSRASWLGGLTVAAAAVIMGSTVGAAWANGAPSTSSVTGWVIDNQPTVASYTPPGKLQYNSMGLTNSIQRTGTGTYTIDFAGFQFHGGSVSVTAAGQTAAVCEVVTWAKNTAGQQVQVACFAPSGAPADEEFDAAYTGLPGASAPAPAVAYVKIDSLNAHEHFPDSDDWYASFTSTGPVATHVSTGRYRVLFPGLDVNAGTASVTAWGDDAATCRIVNWAGTSQGEVFNIACTGPGGVPVDSKSDTSFSEVNDYLGVNNMQEGYAFADRSKASSYHPPAAYSEDEVRTGTPAVTITRQGTGSYRVVFAAAADPGGYVQVTAYGATSDSCQAVSWAKSSADEAVNVECSAASTPADTKFTIQFAGTPYAAAQVPRGQA
jgi:hypothetical protein